MMQTAAGQSGAAAVYPAQKTNKDETVYVNLKSSGEVAAVYVVNHIETPSDGQYTDYGNYTEVVNLTNDVQPAVYQDTVRWNLKKDAKGFYYQGKLASAVLPFQLSVTYGLDGVQLSAEEMAGKAGRVKIHIKVTSNESAAEYFKKNYFCQIQSGLDMDTCSDVSAEKAVAAISGRTKNLAYTVLPGKTAEFDISFQTESFAFDGLTATLLPFDAGNMMDMDTDEIKEGIDDLTEGAQKLADGTGDLKDGLKDLSSGVTKLSNGANDTEAGMKDYKSGLSSYTGGIEKMDVKIEEIVAAANQLAKKSKELSGGFSGLKSGVKGIFDTLTPTAPPELAAQMTGLLGQMDTYAKGLSVFSGGLSDMAGGLAAFAKGLETVADKGDDLVSGMTAMIKGMGKLADGLSTIATEMKKLPGEVGKLLDGQLELKDGIDEAGDTFNDFETNPGSPVSFASDKNTPTSVQFVYKTQEIEKEKEENVAVTDTGEVQSGFFDKLKSLFSPAK
jgi:X-X-X-Leu-X-X-Gly heptad repeat protein